jgi:tRNA nucleotidyltransferase/poly(A) polymerase
MILQILEKILEAAGSSKMYLVGGFVRDLARGKTSLDIDLATPQDPARLARRIAGRLGGTAFPLDKERGIHRVQLKNDIHLDIAQFKGKTLEKDLLARDFTINAMALPLDNPTLQQKAIIDPTGGLNDLRKKTLRAVSKRSFRDDPLRILRAFRIAAELKFSIEKNTLTLIRRERALLSRVSKERIREELLRLFAVPTSSGSLILMDRAGVLKELFPEAKAMERTGRAYYGKGGVWKHSLEAFQILEEAFANIGRLFPRCSKPLANYLEAPVAGHPRHALLKLSELLHDVGKPKTARMIKGRLRFFGHEDVGARMTKKALERLRFSSEEKNRAAHIVQAHMRPGNLAVQPMITDKAIFRFFRDLDDDAIGALLVSLADHLTYVTPRQRFKGKTPHERVTKKMIERYYLRREKIVPKRLIDGHAVMKAFSLKAGPLVGEILSAVQEAHALGQVSNPSEALAWVRKQFQEKLKSSVSQ